MTKHEVDNLASINSRLADLRKHALTGNSTPEGRRVAMKEVHKLAESINDTQKKLAPFIKFQRQKLVNVHAALRRTAPAARPAAAQQQAPKRVRLHQVPATQNFHVVCNANSANLKFAAASEQACLNQVIAGRLCFLIVLPRGSVKMMATLPPMGVREAQYAARNNLADRIRVMTVSIRQFVSRIKTRAVAGRAATEAAAAIVVATPVGPAGPVVASVELRRSTRNKK